MTSDQSFTDTDLCRLALTAKSAQDNLRLAVLRRREQGASWASIGAAIGITRQAAQQRYGKQAKPATQVTGQASLQFSNGARGEILRRRDK